MRRSTGSQKVRSWVRALLRFPFIETISPHDLTVTRMRITEMRIRDYWRIHGRLPQSLDELRPLKKRDNETTDGWGRPIEYVTTPPAKVSLSSEGGDHEKIQFAFRADQDH
jgi:hypothetical protein